MIAAVYQNSCIVELLLEHKANLKHQNKLGLTPLIAAACSGHLPTITLLLKANKSVPTQLEGPNLSGEITPLKASILYEQDNCIRYMLDQKVDANQAGIHTKTTTLMLAASVGKTEIAKLLIDYGADTNLVNVCHQTAHEISSVCGHSELKAFLSEHTLAPIPSVGHQSESQISEAIVKSDIKSLKSLFKSNNNIVNITYSKDGLTPLIQSVLLGNKDVVVTLVHHGADLNAQDKTNGFTALMHSVYHKKRDMVKLLLECGACVYVQGKGSCTALDLAWLNEGTKDIADLLVEWGKSNKAKHMATLNTQGDTDHLSPGSPIYRSRNSFKSLRNDSFKGLVESISQRFQHLKSRKSSFGASYTSPTPSIHEPEDDDNVFIDNTQATEGSGANLVSSSLKLSSFEWPTMDKIKGIIEWQKPVIPPFMPKLPALSNTIPGEFHPTLKECIFANQKKRLIEAFIPHATINKLNKKRGFEPVKFDLSFSKSNSSTSTIFPKSKSAIISPSPTKFMPMQTKYTIQNIDDVLKQLSLERYAKVFHENEIDLQVFKAITNADLEEIGIQDQNHRQKLLKLALNV